MLLKSAIIIISFFSINSLSAQDAVKCNLLFNQFDQLIEIEDTKGALVFLEECKDCHRFITISRHYFMSNIYFDKGRIDLAKEELIFAVKKGYFLNFEITANFWNEFRKIKSRYGSEFAFELIEIQEKALASMSPSNRDLRKKLVSVHNRDQRLRKKPKYRIARGYEFINKLYGDREEDEVLHQEKMKTAKEFRQKDSLVLLEFINISDSMGYVPSSNDLMFNDISALMCHTAHILFEVDIDQLYYNSVMKGTISGKYYAWYKGYYDEYFGDGKSFSYYFTHGEDMFEEANLSDEEIESINLKRTKIGVPELPFTVWSKGGLR